MWFYPGLENHTLWKSVKVCRTYVNFKRILFLVSEIMWNIKLDVYIVYFARYTAVHDMSRLKLTWIDSRFTPVWRLIPFERALNFIQGMWIKKKFLCTAPEKIVFLYGNCLIKKQLMNMMRCSRRGAIRSFVWIESKAECGA